MEERKPTRQGPSHTDWLQVVMATAGGVGRALIVPAVITLPAGKSKGLKGGRDLQRPGSTRAFHLLTRHSSHRRLRYSRNQLRQAVGSKHG